MPKPGTVSNDDGQYMPRPNGQYIPIDADATYIGIDPGKKGGVAIIKGDNVWTFALQEHPEAIWGSFLSIKEKFADIRAAIEQVPVAIFGGAKSSSSKLYGSFKALEMALIASGIEFIYAPAKKWQEVIGIKKQKGESDTHWKNRLLHKAKVLFPRRPLTKEVSDALLIAEYARRVWNEDRNEHTD